MFNAYTLKNLQREKKTLTGNEINLNKEYNKANNLAI
tara:strand:- start:7 stop:117 length:111 start_codon:yes stop_codon:yes gene_type:complete